MALFAATALPSESIDVNLDVVSGEQMPIATMGLILVRDPGMTDLRSFADGTFAFLGEIPRYERMSVTA